MNAGRHHCASIITYVVFWYLPVYIIVRNYCLSHFPLLEKPIACKDFAHEKSLIMCSLLYSYCMERNHMFFTDIYYCYIRKHNVYQ